MKETPRTNYAAYEKHRSEVEDWNNIEERDGTRWCNLLDEARDMERELMDCNNFINRISFFLSGHNDMTPPEILRELEDGDWHKQL